MPPKKRLGASKATAAPRRSTRRTIQSEPRLPDVYQEMLAEAAAEERNEVKLPPRKRQKVSDYNAGNSEPRPVTDVASNEPVSDAEQVSIYPQTIVNDFLSSDDEDEFEDVDLEISEAEDKPEQRVITFSLADPVTIPKKSAKRTVVSLAERRMRLEWHKAHFFLLLVSLWCRNRWCEDSQVQAMLKKLVPRKVVKLLHEDESKPALQRSYSFNKAIEEICQIWRTTWTVVGRGTRRAVWRDDINLDKESDLHEELDLDDFRSAAATHRGSRDLGAQLFCALLRSVAVETRLVCSLQVLPFSAAAKGLTPEKPKNEYTLAGAQNFGSSVSGGGRKKQKDSAYPIFWVEVLSPVTQSWTPLDAVVRYTINKPKTGFEPPASDTLNAMTYVIAIEDDGSARDVTRRYSQWFNAKTRKLRVESTKGGEEWLRSTLARFEKPFPEARDELEDSDLMRRSEAEGMPKNIQDFKGHPVYVLERHLRMNEVIHPKREIGTTTIGIGQKEQKLESVYRRSDVHLCRTSDAWYRRGRDIKQGEVALKRVIRRTRRTPDFDEDGQPEDNDAALYAEFQTEIYVPPPVVDGKVPRNSFGNFDVYVGSMIPAGGIHVRHPLAGKAAKLMGIHFVDAVTGFEFKGRQGTAVVDGIIVAKEARFGLNVLIVGMQNQLIEEAETERSLLLTSLWKRWLTALRIRERIERDYGCNDNGASDRDEDEDATYEDSEDNEGGGFVPNGQASPSTGPVQRGPIKGKDAVSQLLLKGLPPVPDHHEVVVTESPHQQPIEQSRDAKAHPSTTQAVLEADSASVHSGGFLADEGSGGGFLAENEGLEHSVDCRGDDDDRCGGAFIVENAPTPGNDFSSTLNNGSPGDNRGAASAAPAHGTSPQHRHAEGLVIQNKEEHPQSKQHQEQITAGSPSEGHTHDISSEHNSERQLEPSKSPTADIASHQDDEIISNASLLSHDPDEDDAEPEWLMESLGD